MSTRQCGVLIYFGGRQVALVNIDEETCTIDRSSMKFRTFASASAQLRSDVPSLELVYSDTDDRKA